MSAATLLWAAGDVLRALRSEWYPPERLHALQRRLLLAQLHHAYANVPFYQRRWPQDPVEIQLTPEGLRISIFDRSNRPIFDPQSVRFTSYEDWVFSTLAW